MTQAEIQAAIATIDQHIERLKADTTVWRMVWAGSTHNHGPYLRKLEIRRLKAKRRTLEKKLKKC